MEKKPSNARALRLEGVELFSRLAPCCSAVHYHDLCEERHGQTDRRRQVFHGKLPILLLLLLLSLSLSPFLIQFFLPPYSLAATDDEQLVETVSKPFLEYQEIKAS